MSGDPNLFGSPLAKIKKPVDRCPHRLQAGFV
jgi:hypothetical protein